MTKFLYETFLKPGFECNCEVRRLLFIPNQEEEVAADLDRQKLSYFLL